MAGRWVDPGVFQGFPDRPAASMNQNTEPGLKALVVEKSEEFLWYSILFL